MQRSRTAAKDVPEEEERDDDGDCEEPSKLRTRSSSGHPRAPEPAIGSPNYRSQQMSVILRFLRSEANTLEEGIRPAGWRLTQIRRRAFRKSLIGGFRTEAATVVDALESCSPRAHGYKMYAPARSRG
jgi:hypothetical protein